MIIGVAIDDNNGLMFNNRRQSQDRALRRDLLHVSSGKKLWINQYTKMQFEPEESKDIVVDDDFLDKAQNGDICFVEDHLLTPYKDRIEELILYKWNRKYPADLHLDINLDGWILISKTEFAGYSHEKITKEVWVRC